MYSMTDLETMERAKNYMEKLANGINPLDGSAIPDEEVVNNVRLSRCFFYVADVLRQIIENGGIGTQGERSKRGMGLKQPFELTVEDRNGFEFSEKPIPISEISRRINNLIDKETMRSLSYDIIREWLVHIEMLESVESEEGRPIIHPTQQGKKFGIILENRFGKNGPYSVVVYNIDAQRFIVDNLDAICEYEQEHKSNQGKPWTEEQDNCLMELFTKGVPVDEIAELLKRNSRAIYRRLRKLGLRI